MAHESLIEIVKKVKPAIVGVGTHSATSRPKSILQGTGFAIGNGKYIVTNHHVLSELSYANGELREHVVFAGKGQKAKVYNVEVVAQSELHDIAILKHNGPALPALKLADQTFIPEGSLIAFTGFPLGSVLGLYPVTHHGYVASLSPVVIPANAAAKLSVASIKMLKKPYMVYQLDATAYPGNSGSPVYSVDDGMVVGIINKVFVKKTKESAITEPSGITYAIPVRFLHILIKKYNLNIYQ